MSAAALATEPPDLKRYSGPQRAAALLLVLGRDHGGPIWEALSTDEVKELSAAMAQLGRIPAGIADHLLVRFSGQQTISIAKVNPSLMIALLQTQTCVSFRLVSPQRSTLDAVFSPQPIPSMADGMI